jgi:hypothetical protein
MNTTPPVVDPRPHRTDNARAEVLWTRVCAYARVVAVIVAGLEDLVAARRVAGDHDVTTSALTSESTPVIGYPIRRSKAE